MARDNIINIKSGKGGGFGSGSGRPPFQPDDGNRNTVMRMVAYGETQEGIRQCIFGPSGRPISAITLRKHFKSELAGGGYRLKNRIIGRCVMHMEGSPAKYDEDRNLLRAEIKPSESMARFLAKTIIGLRESDPITMVTPGGRHDSGTRDDEQAMGEIQEDLKAITAEKEALGRAARKMVAGGAMEPADSGGGLADLADTSGAGMGEDPDGG